MKPIVISWSGGKDSSRSLFELREEGVLVNKAITTVTKAFDRISMHGVRTDLLEKQCDALGLDLLKIEIPSPCTNEIYEEKMAITIRQLKTEKYDTMAFGDIFLEDLKAYREEKMDKAEMNAIFPIWKMDPKYLAESFIELGFKTIITCVDSEQLDPSFCGRVYDQSFLNDLPASVDPCGENGEFHTFCFDGPIFKFPLEFTKGEIVCRDERFWFCDLIPK